MLGFVTRKEYKKLREKYRNEVDKNENNEIIIEHLKEKLLKCEMEERANEYREQLNDDNIKKLNNVITNLLEKINELNVKITEIKKEYVPTTRRGRKPKKEE